MSDIRGAWVAQSVEHLTLAQFMGSSPTSGSVLTAQRPEPASDSVSPSLSALPLLMLCLLLKNKHFLKIKKKKEMSGISPLWFVPHSLPKFYEVPSHLFITSIVIRSVFSIPNALLKTKIDRKYRNIGVE